MPVPKLHACWHEALLTPAMHAGHCGRDPQPEPAVQGARAPQPPEPPDHRKVGLTGGLVSRQAGGEGLQARQLFIHYMWCSSCEGAVEAGAANGGARWAQKCICQCAGRARA